MARIGIYERQDALFVCPAFHLLFEVERLLRPFLVGAYVASWIAGDDRSRRDGTGHDASRTDDSSVANLDPRHQYRTVSDERSASDPNACVVMGSPPFVPQQPRRAIVRQEDYAGRDGSTFSDFDQKGFGAEGASKNATVWPDLYSFPARVIGAGQAIHLQEVDGFPKQPFHVDDAIMKRPRNPACSSSVPVVNFSCTEGAP